jgi:hypothetical protein
MKPRLDLPPRATAQRRKGIEREGWEAVLDGWVINGVTFNNREDAIAYAARVLAYYEARAQ